MPEDGSGGRVGSLHGRKSDSLPEGAVQLAEAARSPGNAAVAVGSAAGLKPGEVRHGNHHDYGPGWLRSCFLTVRLIGFCLFGKASVSKIRDSAMEVKDETNRVSDAAELYIGDRQPHLYRRSWPWSCHRR